MGVTDFFCGFLSNAKGNNFRNRDTRSRAGRTFGTGARAVTIDAHCRRWIAHRLAEGEKGSESLVALDLLGNAIELGESLRLMEVLSDAADIALNFRILVRLMMNAPKKWPISCSLARAAPLNRPRFREEAEIFVDLGVGECAAVAFAQLLAGLDRAGNRDEAQELRAAFLFGLAGVI